MTKISITLALAVFAGGCMDTMGEPTETGEAAARPDHSPLVTMGASTSAGVAFYVEGLTAEEYLADNHHIPRIAKALRGTGREGIVVMNNLAVGSKRSDEILAEQLGPALSFMSKFTGHKVVTVEGGGNDLIQFQLSPEGGICRSGDPAFDPAACQAAVAALLQQVGANLSNIVGAVVQQHPTATVVMQAQYNPLYGTRVGGVPCADATGIAVAEQAIQGLNQVVGQVAGAYASYGYDVRIADIEAELVAAGAKYDDDTYSPDCTHLSGVWDGIPGLVEGDANGIGYELMYDAYATALGL